MTTNRPNLEWYCRACDRMSEFRYVSSNAASSSEPEKHFYTCANNCGTTYEQRQMLSLVNARRIEDNVVTEER